MSKYRYTGDFRLKEAMCVVIENAVLDTVGLCSLYKERQSIFSDELIDTILRTAPLKTALAFNKQTQGRRNMTMVHRLLDMNFGLVALDLLEESCDQETFTRVLSFPFAKPRPGDDELRNMLVDAITTMKRLGYKREMCVFEGVLKIKTDEMKTYETVFREMVEEHPDKAAHPHIYQDFFAHDKCSLEFKHMVGKEAKAKGVPLQFPAFFNGYRGNWQLALSLLLDIVNDPSEAYQATLNSTCTGTLTPAKIDAVPDIVRQAVEAGATVDPTAVLLRCYRRLKEFGLLFLADGMREGLIIIDDARLAESLRNARMWDEEGNFAEGLFQFAAQNSGQELPQSLREMLQRCCRTTSVSRCLQAFCTLISKPDRSTCEQMIKMLQDNDLLDEARYISEEYLKV